MLSHVAKGILVLSLATSLVSPALAQQTTHVKAGVLTCRTSASLGLIIGSHQKLRCLFKSASGWSEYYVGHINRLGVDLGFKAGGIMAWAVIAPATGVHHGALAGKYAGASGSASFGVGATANVLVGGFHRSFALQPVSLEAQAGLNVALGVAALTLAPAY